MKNCWNILKISPTEDLIFLKQKYHELLQKNNPDKYYSPEDKRRHTRKFVEIIEAYRKACQLIEKDEVSEYLYYKRNQRRWKSLVSALGLIIIVVLIDVFYKKLLSPIFDFINRLGQNNPLYIFIDISTQLIHGVILSILILGWSSLLLIYLSRFIANKLGLEKYQSKICWVVLVIYGVLATKVVMLMGYDFSDSVIASFTIPAVLLLLWIKNLLHHKKNKLRYEKEIKLLEA